MRARLADLLVGSAAREAIDRLATAPDALPPALVPLAATIASALLEILGEEASTRVVVGGVPNLTRFGDQFETTVKPVLEALEEQVVLLRLLGEATSPNDVTVRIGHENPYEPLQSTSVVASAYGADSDACGPPSASWVPRGWTTRPPSRPCAPSHGTWAASWPKADPPSFTEGRR